MWGDEDDDENQEQESVIPGDNDKPSDEVYAKDCPVNLTRIPPTGGEAPEEIPTVSPPEET